MSQVGPTEKAILLAGGTGSRLLPMTRCVNKHLLPVFDKPMVYYPLSTLMLAGIRTVLVVTTPDAFAQYQELLGDGSQWGMDIRIVVQSRPLGVAHAFVVGREFVGQSSVSLILGDNIFCGDCMAPLFSRIANGTAGATVFTHHVKDPENYGIVTLDDSGQPIAIEEKPRSPRSHQAVAGLYFYDHQVLEIARSLSPSSRGELEISDVNQVYLQRRQLQVVPLPETVRWLHVGTPESLAHASGVVQAEQSRLGRKLGCVEEIAFRQGYIDREQLARLADSFGGEYGRYLSDVSESE